MFAIELNKTHMKKAEIAQVKKEVTELKEGIDLTRKLNNIIIDGLTDRLSESMGIIDDYLNSSGKENRAEISIKAKELYERYFDTPYKNRNERMN